MTGGVKRTASDFAVLGGKPAFRSPIRVGQMHFPAWERYEQAMRGICERQWYTNHGPLAIEAEARLAALLGVRNVVCVSSATVGLMMAAKALEIDGTVVLPAFAPAASAQALIWAGATPRFCEIEARDCQLTAETAAAALTGDVQAILGVNLWGEVCDLAGLIALAEEAGIPICFDSAQAFGCEAGGRPVGGYGQLEVFSFHAANVINAGEGGCVSTNDDELAARLRNIRSSYGAGRPVAVPITSNGRFSEAQAALTLLALDDLDDNLSRNHAQLDAYAEGTAMIPGLRLMRPSRAERSNHQSAVVAVDRAEFGLSRDELAKVLWAENVAVVKPCPVGLHRLPQFGRVGHSPVADGGERSQTDEACRSTLQLPLGTLISEEQISMLAGLLGAIPDAAAKLAAVSSG